MTDELRFFRRCDGCGTPTGENRHKPPRLCEDCSPLALWAEPGDWVQHASGALGQVVDEPHETVSVLTGGRIEEWPITEATRLAFGPEEPTFVPDRRKPCDS